MDYAMYKQLRKQTEDVTFLYLYNEHTAAEDFQAFEKLCVDGIGTLTSPSLTTRKFWKP